MYRMSKKTSVYLPDQLATEVEAAGIPLAALIRRGLRDHPAPITATLTAPEHYSEAQQLLAKASRWAIAEPDRLDMLAEAQVHATLALFPGSQS